jgi:tetratricopeptide (TPR) repeat protein
MLEATPETVLGDFDDATYTYAGITSSFRTQGGKFFVTTDGPDGQLTEYEIRYTFGVDPLQQYMVAFPGGRYQLLPLAWDTRPAEKEGQRWFHLYPDQNVRHEDPLHWTRGLQTWNYMCADCHSTDLKEGFDVASNTYDTTFSDINVSCEACHGPGSNHIRWAERKPEPDKSDRTMGLVLPLPKADGYWSFEGQESGIAKWVGAPRTARVVDSCAPCHSRRRPTRRDVDLSEPFLDSYQPALLTEGLYHADGQILEEVYVYASFLQSKMHGAGVVCTDCHNPHTTSLKGRDNEVCNQCHLPAKYDVVEHHHHEPKTEAARCVACHMIQRTYMVVDPRRDHSFRVPRPDLNVALGTPDACTDCHREKGPQWNADWVVKWYGPERKDAEHYAYALHAGRTGEKDVERRLVAIIQDTERPAIVRATALDELRQWMGPHSASAVGASLADPNPLVRASALRALEPLPAEYKAEKAAPLLSDPSRHVRIAAATTLASVRRTLLDANTTAALETALDEAIEAELANGERPESHVNISLLYLAQARVDEAEASLRTALAIEPGYVPALVNLADIRRAQGRDEEARVFLDEAVAREPRPAEAVHALGLLEVRAGRRERGLKLLEEATRLLPDNAQFAYVFAIGLHSSGDVQRAVDVLERTHRKAPAQRDVLAAIISFEEERGNLGKALEWARVLQEVSPDNLEVAARVKTLEAMQ